MPKEPSLKERVAILEERLKVYEAPPEYKLALADSTARLRSAREESQRMSQRMQRLAIIFAISSAVFSLTLDVFLAVR
jgi:hypothetical protein